MTMILFLASIAALSSSQSEGSNPWAGRSGEAEALADIATGRPVQLYLQSTAGERGVDHAPGLLNCSPDRGDVPIKALNRFKPLGADYSESIIYTAEQVRRLHSATLFARAYNLAMFRKRREQVLEICPSAEVDAR